MNEVFKIFGVIIILVIIAGTGYFIGKSVHNNEKRITEIEHNLEQAGKTLDSIISNNNRAGKIVESAQAGNKEAQQILDRIRKRPLD